MTIPRKPQRVLLIHPGTEETGGRKDFPPWGIIFVGQALARHGHQPKILDLNGESDIEEIVSGVADSFQPDILGITGKWGRAARRAERLFRLFANRYPEVRRVLGGPLASTLPPNAAITKLPHAILAGDGETSILRWIEAGMPEVWQLTPAQDADLSLNSLDTEPLFDLTPYVRPGERSDLGVPSLYISGARGCVARCSFCYTLAHAPAGLRESPAKRLVEDMALLQRRYGVDGFYFVDDGLVSRGPWRRDFCERVRRHGGGMVWGVDLRTAEATETCLRELWEGQCRALYMGLETADDASHQTLLRKGRTVGGVGSAIDRALGMGFRVRASVVIGWPGETQASVERTIRAVESRPDLLIDVFRYNPLPNTALARDLALRFGPNHIYTEYGPDAPNVSDCSDVYLDWAWTELTRIANERNGTGIKTLS